MQQAGPSRDIHFVDEDEEEHHNRVKKKKKKKKKANANGYAVESPDEQNQMDDQQWNLPAFKPRRDYEVPGIGKQPGTLANALDKKSLPPNPTQQTNEYLMQRVNDPAYQKQLQDNQIKNQVNNSYLNSKVLKASGGSI